MRVLPEHKKAAWLHANTNHKYYDDRNRPLEVKIRHIYNGKLCEIVLYHYLNELLANPPDLDCSNRISDDGFDFKTHKPMEAFVYDWSYQKTEFESDLVQIITSDMIDVKCAIKRASVSNGFLEINFPSHHRRAKLKEAGKWGDQSPFYLGIEFDEIADTMTILGYIHGSEMDMKPYGLIQEKYNEAVKSNVLYVTTGDLVIKAEDAAKIEQIKNSKNV